MRIHSDFIEEADVRKAARLAGVSFTRLNLHGSRKRAGAFDVILTGSSPRCQNTRQWGADKAATWDEWGHFLGLLFALDPAMDTPYYSCADEFHWITNGRFRNAAAGDFTPGHTHKWEFSGRAATGAYAVHECSGRNACGAIFRRGDWNAVNAA